MDTREVFDELKNHAGIFLTSLVNNIYFVARNLVEEHEAEYHRKEPEIERQKHEGSMYYCCDEFMVLFEHHFIWKGTASDHPWLRMRNCKDPGYPARIRLHECPACGHTLCDKCGVPPKIGEQS